jgi:cytochrome P450
VKRINNAEHLTFGIGGHMCLARHFSINMATEALSYLFEKYKMVNLADDDIKYEPRINVRLPKNILISLT